MTDVLILRHVRPVLHDVDGLVVMGGPMGVSDLDDRPHLSREIDLIEQALRNDRPVPGVCLGSQLLAHVLGADVRSAPTKEIGWNEISRRTQTGG